jgi:transposase-like protein
MTTKETVRQWMIRGKLWRAKPEKVKKVHAWRPRRSRFGELVQWDTSEHDWLEGRGEKLYLIAMIDYATSRLFARFVGHDSTEENMKLLRSYLEKFGRPIAFYTDKASLFQTAEKRKRDEPGVEKDAVEMPRRKSAAPWGNWGSPGLRRILRRPKVVWKGISKRPKIGWSKGCVWPG